MSSNDKGRQWLSLAATGSGGAGVMTVGGLLLEAAGSVGYYGLQTRSVGPQIRGGEAAAMVRLSTTPVNIHDGQFDILFALDWRNFERFSAEIDLGKNSLVLFDPESGTPPDLIAASGAKLQEIAVQDITSAITGGRANMVALGVLAAAAGITAEQLSQLVVNKLESKGEQVITAGMACIEAGYDTASSFGETYSLAPPVPSAGDRWIVTGNEAAALGAVRGGIRFAAAYPITPATEILEWLSSALPKVGGSLVQAEDELSSINMAIGASYGGIPSLTATSGPGLALMTEALGLATAAEVPVVIVNVMRGGPSTGIPTKSEQSDLNIAVYGLHGDAPHVVLAPATLADCLITTQWAAHLADAMQVPVIVLSDQFLGQTRAIIERPAEVAFLAARKRADKPGADYARYAISESGVSAMSLPGTPGGQYTADGLEHNPRGLPSTAAEDHQAQLDKRARKLENFDFGSHWADIDGEGELAMIAWGSTGPAMHGAAEKMRAAGHKVKTIVMRLLLPSRPEDMAAALKGVKKLLVIDQSHSAQFHRYLRAHYDLPSETHSFNRAGPMLFTAGEIFNQAEQWRRS